MGLVDIDGLRIHYRSVGDVAADTGRKLLYVHGTGCDGRVWERHMRAMAAWHTPVAIDLPGHGESGGQGFRGVVDYTYYTLRLADALGWQRFVIAGHSLGGAVALAASVYYPARLIGMLLVDTGARLRVDPNVLENSRRLATGQVGIPIDPRLGFSRSTPQALVDRLNALTAETDPRVTYRDWLADDSFDFMTRVAHIHTPSLAICGDEDSFTPVKYAEYFRDRMPNCRLQVIAQAGHWTYEEQPETFDRIVKDYVDGLAD